MRHDPEGSNTPLARDLLVKSLQFRDWARVEQALSLLRRAKSVRRAPEKSRKINAEEAAKIRAYTAAHPEMSIQEIANHFGTNSGRVSEALHKLR